MRKLSAVSIIFLTIITTNSETNNAQAIVDADVNVPNDKSMVNGDRVSDDKICESFIKDSEIYQQLEKEYNQLCEVNEELSEENVALKEENSRLKYQAENIPEIQYRNIGLSVDGRTCFGKKV